MTLSFFNFTSFCIYASIQCRSRRNALQISASFDMGGIIEGL